MGEPFWGISPRKRQCVQKYNAEIGGCVPGSGLIVELRLNGYKTGAGTPYSMLRTTENDRGTARQICRAVRPGNSSTWHTPGAWRLGEIETDRLHDANAKRTQPLQTFRRVVPLAVGKPGTRFALVGETDAKFLRLRFRLRFRPVEKPLALPKPLSGVHAPALRAGGVRAFANLRPCANLRQ
jgi:hypothetical protein